MCTLASVCENEIVERLFDECDEDGYYEGGTILLNDVITSIVKNVYGNNVEVVIELDEISS
jgi:hypothetical protein